MHASAEDWNGGTVGSPHRELTLAFTAGVSRGPVSATGGQACGGNH